MRLTEFWDQYDFEPDEFQVEAAHAILADPETFSVAKSPDNTGGLLIPPAPDVPAPPACATGRIPAGRSRRWKRSSSSRARPPKRSITSSEHCANAARPTGQSRNHPGSRPSGR